MNRKSGLIIKCKELNTTYEIYEIYVQNVCTKYMYGIYVRICTRYMYEIYVQIYVPNVYTKYMYELHVQNEREE